MAAAHRAQAANTRGSGRQASRLSRLALYASENRCHHAPSMSRYYNILLWSLQAHGSDDKPSRRIVYGRARAELDRLLANAGAAVSRREAIAHKTELEESIARMEGEYAVREFEQRAGRAGPAQDARESPPVRAVAPEPAEPMPESPSRGLLGGLFRRREQDDESAIEPDKPQASGATSRRVLVIGGIGVYSMLAPKPVAANNLDVATELLTGERALVFEGGVEGVFKARRGHTITIRSGLFSSHITMHSTRKTASPTGFTGGVRYRIPQVAWPELGGKILRVTLTARAGIGQAGGRIRHGNRGRKAGLVWLGETSTPPANGTPIRWNSRSRATCRNVRSLGSGRISPAKATASTSSR